jgi:hypothetical protein
MTTLSIDHETDPVRRAILAAMNRLFAGRPQRSSGRLNVTQLAIEADVKRWHLTHQHLDLRDLFQARAAEAETDWEARLHTYATALNLISLENAALSGQGAEAPKVRALPHPASRLP